MKGGGSDPKGEEEPLKKNFLRKQQQGAAAPNPAAAVFFCLTDRKIPKQDKEWITSRYDEMTVTHALDWVISQGDKIKNEAASLKWACANNPEIPIAPEDLVEQNKKAAALIYAGRINVPHAFMNLLNEGVELGYDRGQVPITIIPWKSKNFVELLEKDMKKRGLKI